MHRPERPSDDRPAAGFLLKVLAVGGIAGSVFGFYLWDLRQDDVEPERGTAKHAGVRVFAGLAAASVGAAIVGGVSLAGSPEKARSMRLDDQREVDLQMISQAADVYWTQNHELPADLEQLSRERGVRVRSIHDPGTAEPYEYRLEGYGDGRLKGNILSQVKERHSHSTGP